MIIGSLDTKRRVLIIAEIGNNHEGSFDLARQLVEKAADAGVDAIKLQTYRTEHYISKSDQDRFRRLKSFELTYRQFDDLAGMCRSLGLLFISTPFDLASADFLAPIVDSFKISSGDVDFYPLLDRVLRAGKPLILSSGISDLRRINETIGFVKRYWSNEQVAERLALLHCVSSYPVAPEEASLRSIRFLAERLDCTIGYSDHTLGGDAVLLAVALGAEVIEKHFTIDKRFSSFRDHQLSANPEEMGDLVHRVRMASLMLGAFEKRVQPGESEAVRSLRRSMVAGGDLCKGQKITWADVTWVRPGGGLAPGQEHLVVGRVLKRDLSFGEPLQEIDLE
jgi:N,N'-diacetyllegionaminate synthase